MSDKVSTIPSYDSAKESLLNYLSFLMNESEGYSEGENPAAKDSKRKGYHDAVMETFGFEHTDSYARDRYFGFPNLDAKLKAYKDEIDELAKYYYAVIVDAITDSSPWSGEISTAYGFKQRIPVIISYWKKTFERAYKICRANADAEWKMVEEYDDYINATVEEGKRYELLCFSSYSHDLNAAEGMYHRGMRMLERVNLKPMEFFTRANVAEYVTKMENLISSALSKMALNDLWCRMFMEKFKENVFHEKWDYSKFMEWKNAQSKSPTVKDSEKKLNCERFKDWDSAYDAWLKEDAIPHPDSVAYTNEGKCMRMCSMFAQWLYSPASS